MAEEAVDEAIAHFGLKPKGISNPPLVSGVEGFMENIKLDGSCPTSKLKLIGAHGFSNTLFINLIQHYGVETEVAKHLTESYGDRAWMVAALCAPTERGFPVRGERISPLYPYVDGEIRYACRHEYAETAADAIGRRTRLSFLNAQASLEALPKIIDLMAEEHQWSEKRKAFEWTDAVQYLGTMGLQPHKLTLTRADVENGNVGGYDDELYARHGKPRSTIPRRLISHLLTQSTDQPNETLETDARMISGRNPAINQEVVSENINPAISKDSPANK